MYTEDEAKKKNCCKAWVSTCDASQCMAWRWFKSDYNPEEHPIGIEVEVISGGLKVTTHGYCGLAGKP